MKQAPLSVTIFIGSEQIDKLTTAQLDKMAEVIAEHMSAFYSANPNEFKKLKN